MERFTGKVSGETDDFRLNCNGGRTTRRCSVSVERDEDDPSLWAVMATDSAYFDDGRDDWQEWPDSRHATLEEANAAARALLARTAADIEEWEREDR